MIIIVLLAAIVVSCLKVHEQQSLARLFSWSLPQWNSKIFSYYKLDCTYRNIKIPPYRLRTSKYASQDAKCAHIIRTATYTPRKTVSHALAHACEAGHARVTFFKERERERERERKTETELLRFFEAVAAAQHRRLSRRRRLPGPRLSSQKQLLRSSCHVLARPCMYIYICVYERRRSSIVVG